MVKNFFMSEVKAMRIIKHYKVKGDHAQVYFGRALQLEILLWLVFLVEEIWDELVRFLNKTLSSFKAWREISNLAATSSQAGSPGVSSKVWLL